MGDSVMWTVETRPCRWSGFHRAVMTERCCLRRQVRPVWVDIGLDDAGGPSRRQGADGPPTGHRHNSVYSSSPLSVVFGEARQCSGCPLCESGGVGWNRVGRSLLRECGNPGLEGGILCHAAQDLFDMRQEPIREGCH